MFSGCYSDAGPIPSGLRVETKGDRGGQAESRQEPLRGLLDLSR